MKRFLFFSFLLAINWQAIGQEGFTDHNWFLGQSEFCLKFGRGNNAAVRLDSLQNTAFGQAGSAVATDPFSGNFLFYTDGVNVYNAIHQTMGTLGGDNTLNQPVAIAPLPDTTDFYYILFNTGSGVDYQVVNMNLNEIPGANIPLGGFAPLTGTAFNVPVTSAMLVLRGDDVFTNWLVVQNAVTNEYIVLRIAAGQNFTPVDTLSLSQTFTAENFSYSAVRNQIAIAPREPNFNVHLLDFDPATGQLSVPDQDSIILNTAGTATPAVFDTEWSPEGTKIYASINTSSNQDQVLQYDLANDSTTVFVNPILPTSVFRSYGLRAAPDSLIYHLYQQSAGGPFLMGVINNPDFIVDSVGYSPLAFENQDFGGTQFPGIAPPDRMMEFEMEILLFDTCIANTTKFLANVTPEPVNYFWDFGDGGTANIPNPLYQYQSAGNFDVTLIVSGFGITDTLVRPVSIGDPGTFMLNLGNDTTICDPLVIPTGSGMLTPESEVSQVVWSTGEVQSNPPYEITVPDTTQTYWAAVTLNNGCELYDEIEITEFGEQEQVFNYWHFGNAAGINFLTDGPVPLDFNLPLDSSLSVSPNWLGIEGSASISDRNGDLLYYSNGRQVYNKDNVLMAGPDGSTPADAGGSETSAQSSIFVQLPDNQPYYYLFTTREVFDGAGLYTLSYTVIDAKLDSARGQVIQQNVPLYSRATERLTVFGGGGQNAWIISHEYGNNSFRAYPLTAEGLGDPVISSAGSIHSVGTDLEGQGYMKMNGAGDLLAVALPTSGENFIELFNFNSATGEITEAVSRIPAGGSGPVYGLEFSPQSIKLYASFLEPSSTIREFQIDSLDRDYIVNVSQQINLDPDAGEEYGAIQVAPDGQIYVAVQNRGSLASITPVEDSLQVSTFSLEGLSIVPGVSTIGLPNFSQQISSPIGSASVTVGNACALPDSVEFTGGGSYDTDEFEYRIFDLSTGTPILFDQRARSQDPDYTAGLPAGDYEVRFLVYNICSDEEPLPYDGDTVQFTVDNAPENFLPTFVSICNDPVEIIPLIPDQPGFSYSWSTGDTTRTTSASVPGIVSLTITTQGGCARTESVQVIDGNPPVDIGPPNQGFCEGETIPDLNAGNPGAAYQWFVNGTEQTGITTQTFSVNSSAVGSFEYIVLVTDPVTFCVGSDTTVINILETPEVASFNVIPSTCGNSDGRIVDLLIDPPGGNYSFSWNTGATTDSLVDVPAGSYTVVVTDNVSGCFDTEVITVSDGNSTFMVDPIADVSACPGDLDAVAQVSTDINDSPYEYIITDRSTGQQVGGTQVATTQSFDVTGLDVGNYSIQITGQSGCIQNADFNINSQPAVQIQYPSTISVCGSGLIEPVSTVNNVSVTWSPSDLLSAPTGQIISIDFSGQLSPTNPSDTLVLTGSVEDLTGTLCDTTVTITVIGSVDPDIRIDQSGDVCAGAVDLTAFDNNFIPGNTYSYQWIRSDTSQTVVSNSQSVSVGAPFTGEYFVNVRNTVTGCESADTIALNVESLSINLTSSPQCDNLLPIVLTTEVVTGSPGTFTYFLDGEDVTQNPSSPLLEINSIAEQGMYEVLVTSFSGQCDTTAMIEVNINEATPVELSDTTFCSRNTSRPLNVDAGPGFEIYEWDLNGTIISNQQILTLPVGMAEDQTGLYQGSFTNDAGCTTIETFFVNDDCSPRVIVPNAFAPSANPPNNAFRIVPNAFGSDVDFVAPDDFEVFIYNRWGELVFYSDSKDFIWEGLTDDGEQAQMGTYTYFMRFRSIFEEGQFEQRGGVVLIR